MIYAKHGSMHISGSARPTSTEIHGFVDRHASELIAVEGTTSATAASLHVGASLGSIVFLVWHRDEVQGFLEKLRNGVGMESDDMLRLVRDRLLRETMGGLARVHSSVKAAWLVKGWNGHVTGARARILKFDAQREEFPMIRFARQDLAV
jgi:hypothetical protein